MARPESWDCDNRNSSVYTAEVELSTIFSKHRAIHLRQHPSPFRYSIPFEHVRGRNRKEIDKELVLERWKEELRRHFPDLRMRFYIIPPNLFNQVCYREVSIGKDVIKIPQPNSQTSDVRAGEARQRVLISLTLMLEDKTEVMVVMSSLCFDNYLNGGGKASPSVKKKKQHNSLSHRSRSEQTSPLQSSQRPYNRPYHTTTAYTMRAGTLNSNQSRYRKMPDSDVSYMEKSSASTSFLNVDLSLFRRPRDLPGHLQRGEVDVLIIHRDYGLLAVEVKALGDRFPALENDPGAQRNIIRKRIDKSLQQLRKHVEVLRYILPEVVQYGVAITAVLMLPNLTRETVQEAMKEDLGLVQDFCRCFETSTLDEALQKCVFSDQLPPTGQAVSADDDIIQALYRDWWLPLTRGITSRKMAYSLYESIIARFCGPATKQYVSTANNPRAEVATLSQAVMETSRCFTGQVLTEEQVSMLGCQSPRVWLSGPPGTGTSLMLQLKAMEWLRQGHRVMMVSLWPASHAATLCLHNKVKQNLTAEQTSKLFCVLSLNPCFEDVLTKLLELTGQTHLIQSLYSGFGDYDITDTCYDSNDEIDSQEDKSTDSSEDDLSFMERHTRKATKNDSKIWEICTSLEGIKKQIPTKEHRDQYLNSSQTTDPLHHPGSTGQSQTLHVIVDEAPWFLDIFMLVLETVLGKDGFVIWAATSLPCTPPSSFKCFELTRNLRCPPSVVREMMETSAYKLFRRAMYMSKDTGVLSGMPLPTDGPMVKRVQHHGHRVKDVWDCEQCGKEVAKFLTHDLKIGNTAAGTSALSAASDSTLHYSDVLISGHLPTLDSTNRSMQEGRTHDTDFRRPTFRQFSFPAAEHHLPGFLKGLDQNRVPFELMVKGDVGSYHRLADPQSSDCVQVTEADMVKGLERAVVVVLGTVDFAETLPRYVDPLYDVMGCCTSQLVIVGDAESRLADRLKGLR